MYVVYLSCDFVTKMIIKIFWKTSLISGLWFGIAQFLNRNIQACLAPIGHTLKVSKSQKHFF